MASKIIYVLVYSLAIADMIVISRALKRVDKYYGRLLRKALWYGMAAIFANIMIALAVNAVVAEIAYCIYFASINWIMMYLTGFCLSYTEHDRSIRILKIPVILIMAIDTATILANPITKMHFIIFENPVQDTVFYQTTIFPAYYVHLTIDYIAVLVTIFFIVYRIIKSYDIYRMKYVLILGVLLLVVILNIIYMAFSLLLDASVVFYAVAATLIYFSITRFVPQKLMTGTISMAVDDMNEGLILFDVSNQCIFANAFSKRRFALSEKTATFESEPMASTIRSLSSRNQQYGKSSYTKLQEAGREFREEHYQIRYNLLKDRKNRPIGSYFLIEDDTEEVSYLKQINAAKNEADEANRAKSDFLANMSHEIRTPLNAVLGMNEMILRKTDDPALLEYAVNIRNSGKMLLNLINDILDFSRIEARKMELIPVEYAPHNCLRECFERFERMAEEKDLTFTADGAGDIPSKLVGDERYIIQILSNIISNAIKYTRTGGVTVKMCCTPVDREHVKLIATVSDTGIGIDQKDIPCLFDAFQRVNEKENATIQGTGLGLAITKKLVEIMNGTIKVDSTIGKGSTFTVSIEQKVADPAPSGPFELREHKEKETYRESFRAPDARILVVDDVSVNLIVISELLSKTEVKVEKATGGDEAIDLCRNRKYDLILLDHRMPNKDGVETFAEIRAEGLNTETPVIMLTANALSGAKDQYRSLGLSDYLSKPVDSAELEEMLIKHLPKEKVIR